MRSGYLLSLCGHELGPDEGPLVMNPGSGWKRTNGQHAHKRLGDMNFHANDAHQSPINVQKRTHLGMSAGSMPLLHFDILPSPPHSFDPHPQKRILDVLDAVMSDSR